MKLFERDHRGIRLTPAGLMLMPSVTEAFDVIERGTRHLAGAVERDRLIVSLPPTFATQWFSSRLGGLAHQLPEVDLSIRTQDSIECHCRVRFGRDAQAHGQSELLLMEHHALVGSALFSDMEVEGLLDRLPALHVLHEDMRLKLWPNWLAQAGMPARYAENGIEFSNLQQAIHAARRGVGLAIVDLNMIADELTEGALVRLSDVDIVGPFGYWLDVPEAYRETGTVSAFADWLRRETTFPGK